MNNIEEALKKVPQQPQRQEALDDQLRMLRRIADRFGLYDAADFIGKALER